MNYHAIVHVPQLGVAGDQPRKLQLDMKGSHSFTGASSLRVC
jgi:hypothetical protein